MNQATQILKHIKEHGSINVLEAEKEPINCKRLAARIDDIQNGRGVEATQIKSTMVRTKSAKHVSEYSLLSDEQKQPKNRSERKGVVLGELYQTSNPCPVCGSYYRRSGECNQNNKHKSKKRRMGNEML